MSQPHGHRRCDPENVRRPDCTATHEPGAERAHKPIPDNRGGRASSVSSHASGRNGVDGEELAAQRRPATRNQT